MCGRLLTQVLYSMDLGYMNSDMISHLSLPPVQVKITGIADG